VDRLNSQVRAIKILNQIIKDYRLCNQITGKLIKYNLTSIDYFFAYVNFQ